MQQEAHSGKGAIEIGTNEYRVSDLENIKVWWEDLDLNMNNVFQPGINIFFASRKQWLVTWLQWLKTSDSD